MARKTSAILGLLAALVFAGNANALLISPSTATASTNVNNNLGSLSAINSAFGTSYSGVELLVKVPDGEGSISSSYSWLPTLDLEGEVTGGVLSFLGSEYADCPVCFLIVKDGKNQPAQYLFDLGSWNGMESLVLSGFWVDVRGGISNVALWGTSKAVPEPGMLLLLGSGLLGISVLRRRRPQAS